MNTEDFIAKATDIYGDYYDYCLKNSIPLLRIKINELKNITEILSKNLLKV